MVKVEEENRAGIGWFYFSFIWGFLGVLFFLFLFLFCLFLTVICHGLHAPPSNGN